MHVDWKWKYRRLIELELKRRRINTYPFLLKTAANFSEARQLANTTMHFDLLIVDPLTRTNNAPNRVCLGSKGGVGLEFLRLVFENRWPALAGTAVVVFTAMPKESVIGQEIIRLGGDRVIWLAKPFWWRDISDILIKLFCR